MPDINDIIKSLQEVKNQCRKMDHGVQMMIVDRLKPLYTYCNENDSLVDLLDDIVSNIEYVSDATDMY